MVIVARSHVLPATSLFLALSSSTGISIWTNITSSVSVSALTVKGNTDPVNISVSNNSI